MFYTETEVHTPEVWCGKLFPLNVYQVYKDNDRDEWLDDEEQEKDPFRDHKRYVAYVNQDKFPEKYQATLPPKYVKIDEQRAAYAQKLSEVNYARRKEEEKARQEFNVLYRSTSSWKKVDEELQELREKIDHCYTEMVELSPDYMCGEGKVVDLRD